MNTSSPYSRRQWLHAGAGMAIGSLLQGWQRHELRAARNSAESQGALGRSAAKAEAVIMIFNCGAPSHLDLWDMKPDAGREIRGEFSPIQTNVPGMHVSELMPQVAQRMDKLTVIRSLHHTQAQHNSGMYYTTVGRPYPIDSTLINPTSTDYPSLGTLVGWLAQRDHFAAALPPYVITPKPHCDSFQYITPGQFGGCLGVEFDPFVLNADPNAANFEVPNLTRLSELSVDRTRERRSLLDRLDRRVPASRLEAGRAFDLQMDRAFRLLDSESAATAFDLSREPDHVRERYGRHSWGQSHLLARRLIESGVRFVSTVNGPSIVWDTHENNFERMKNSLVPPMEQAYVALLDDLQERGLLEKTLVLWIGDFGRTPKINDKAGRDHWPQCYSAVVAGGGVSGGRYVGESDSIGARPQERPVTPADLHATLFRLLGYDPHAVQYETTDGRPTLLSEGTPIHELL